jgi:hypothetical protein
MLEEFNELYDAVFDEEGKIKACGRTACEKLIAFIKSEFGEIVGDEATGFITKPNKIRELYCHIN